MTVKEMGLAVATRRGFLAGWEGMDTKKVLVIGSTKHQHVACVGWEDTKSVNIVDFDAVVVNVHSLSDNSVRKLFASFRELRISLARLLMSRGNIIVLGAAFKHVDYGKTLSATNYSWSPVNFAVVAEAGNTVNLVSDDFSKYLAKLRDWSFYYVFNNSFLSSELADVCGGSSVYKYLPHRAIFAQNRYGHLLAGSLHFQVLYEKIPARQSGRLSLLPRIDGIDDRQAVNLVLEDMLGLPQETLAPEWAVRWPPKTGQSAKRESSLGTVGWPEVKLVEYTEETQS
jgi:hypothetical protein